MHYSGLIIQSDPKHIRECALGLERCPGVEVFVTDDPSGRIVAVLETETLEEQEKGLRLAQELPHVLTAELVYHYFGDVHTPASPVDKES